MKFKQTTFETIHNTMPTTYTVATQNARMPPAKKNAIRPDLVLKGINIALKLDKITTLEAAEIEKALHRNDQGNLLVIIKTLQVIGTAQTPPEIHRFFIQQLEDQIETHREEDDGIDSMIQEMQNTRISPSQQSAYTATQFGLCPSCRYMS